MNLRKEIKEELLNIAYGHGDEVFGVDQLLELFKKYALEMVGEDIGDNLPDSDTKEIVNLVKQQIRRRIEESTK